MGAAYWRLRALEAEEELKEARLNAETFERLYRWSEDCKAGLYNRIEQLENEQPCPKCRHRECTPQCPYWGAGN